MKIACYCQHVLGVGHLHRSLALCTALCRRHEVTLITGGAPAGALPEGIAAFQLPGLMMDADFANLAPSGGGGRSLDEVKTERAHSLWSFFDREKPEVFLVELYPFGRKKFRFELDPVLTAIKAGRFGTCRSYCSLRDILVERDDREKFEARAVTTLNSLFDGLLIHGDEQFIPLERTFGRVDDIAVPIAYTGYVAPPATVRPRSELRRELGVAAGSRLVVGSIGGGGVGSELLLRLVEAVALLADANLHLQLFTGPYAPEKVVAELRRRAGARVTVSRFTDRFPDWLKAADLSVSMAGYNTTMNLLAAGTPALLFPFSKNREQSLRIEALARSLPLAELGTDDLEAPSLAARISAQLGCPRFLSPLRLDGAEKTLALIEQWHGRKG